MVEYSVGGDRYVASIIEILRVMNSRDFPVINIYLFKVDNRNTRKSCEIMFKVSNKDTRTTSMT